MDDAKKLNLSVTQKFNEQKKKSQVLLTQSKKKNNLYKNATESEIKVIRRKNANIVKISK